MQHSKMAHEQLPLDADTDPEINMFSNFISEKYLRGSIFSKKNKTVWKSAVKFINNFETTAADIGISNKYDYVICGHIHQPEMKTE